MDSGISNRKLRHQHLPSLADAGDVRREDDPFVVQRGPRSGEPAAIIEMVTAFVDDLPAPSMGDCKIFRTEVEHGRH